MKNTFVFALAFAILGNALLSPITVEAKVRKGMKPRNLYEYMTQSPKNEIRCMDLQSKCPDWRSK